jgi:hypothetical protein
MPVGRVVELYPYQRAAFRRRQAVVRDLCRCLGLDCLRSGLAVGRRLCARQTYATKRQFVAGAGQACHDRRHPVLHQRSIARVRTALLHVYGQWRRPARKGTRGAFPKLWLLPPEDLLYAQVVKQRERGAVVAVTTKTVFGTDEAVQARLTSLPTSTTINTSFVERDNLTLRQHNRRLTRKTNALSKEMVRFEKQLWLALAYYHLVIPHMSLRQRLAAPAPTCGAGTPVHLTSGPQPNCCRTAFRSRFWRRCRQLHICFHHSRWSIKAVEGHY